MAVSVNGSGTTTVQTRPSQASETAIQPFLQTDFDPAEYLNNALPTLSTTTSSNKNTPNARAVHLPELPSQLQTLLSQLNAQTSRLSDSLTQLTDEIIRSGGRLAYEVEVLRGETIGLKDLLDGRLRSDLDVFTASPRAANTGEEPSRADVGAEVDSLERLKTLTSVRARLDSVIKVFGEAMQWPVAPSEVSVAGSLISVSAPDGGDDARSREEKGKAYVERLRNEVVDLVGSGNDPAGLEAANAKIAELKELAEVWHGTSEEKARGKLVKGLQKLVDERQRASEKGGGSRRPTPAPARPIDHQYGSPSSKPSADSGYGFLQNLRNLKNEV